MRDNSLIEIPEECSMLRSTLMDWAKATITPHAQSWDHEEELPAPLLREADELGLNLIALPEERGGAGMGHLAALHAVEVLAQFEGSLALKVALMNGPVAVCWPQELNECSGTWASGALQVTEGGSSGLLRDVPWSESARWLMVPQGDRLYLIDLQANGVRLIPHSHRLSLRCAEWSDVVLEGAKTLAFPLTRDQRALAEAWMNLGWAALAVGLGTAGAKLGLSYAQESVQFGKALTDFQAIQWMIADNVTELDAARLLTYQAARVLEAGDLSLGARLASEARLLAMEAGYSACDRGLQMHGGYGYTKDYQVERYWRDIQRCFPTSGESSLTQNIIERLTRA